jgi:hypothetical protein
MEPGQKNGTRRNILETENVGYGQLSGQGVRMEGDKGQEKKKPEQ